MFRLTFASIVQPKVLEDDVFFVWLSARKLVAHQDNHVGMMGFRQGQLMNAH